jgi:nitrous oxidase accessory protein
MTTMRKWIVVGMVVLLLGSCVPVLAQTAGKTRALSGAGWLYVGGSGPGNYSKIQDAIDAAADGDAVFVYDDLSPYREAVKIVRTLSLIGEDKQTTVIDAGDFDNASVVNVSADSVVIQGFTIQNGDSTNGYEGDGVEILANRVLIRDNIIIDNGYDGVRVGGYHGFQMAEANQCVLEGNLIQNNTEGVYLISGNCTISDNQISNNLVSGICVYSSDNLISCNNITLNGGEAISISYAANNIIEKNNVVGNFVGIILTDSSNNSILQNNIFENRLINVCAGGVFLTYIQTKQGPFKNIWDGNYWGNSRRLPKPIYGYLFFAIPSMWLMFCLHPLKLLHFILTGSASFNFLIPLGVVNVKFDRHPAQEPYVIPTMN